MSSTGPCDQVGRQITFIQSPFDAQRHYREGGGLTMDLTSQKKTTKDRLISIHKINIGFLRMLTSGRSAHQERRSIRQFFQHPHNTVLFLSEKADLIFKVSDLFVLAADDLPI
jgi:hypothetical protein